MSYWTHIMGVIEVSPMGRTQHEKTYILNTVLDHLPQVTGSEGNMHIIVNQHPDYNISSSHDEFGMRTNNLKDRFGDCSRDRGWMEMTDRYFLLVIGDLRDRQFRQTFMEFQKWLCRLAKRVIVYGISVTISADYGKKCHLEYGYYNPYHDMFEWPVWDNEDEEPAWYEYLMWEREPISTIPLKHIYKYYNDADVDTEMKRRSKWREELSDGD